MASGKSLPTHAVIGFRSGVAFAAMFIFHAIFPEAHAPGYENAAASRLFTSSRLCVFVFFSGGRAAICVYLRNLRFLLHVGTHRARRRASSQVLAGVIQ